MKKILFTFACLYISMVCSAQALHIYHDGEKTPDVLANGCIDSIYFAPKFLGSIEYQTVFLTKDGVKRYDVIDSLKFNLPHLAALRHTYFIPTDYKKYNGYLQFIVSRSEEMNDEIRLTCSDGTPIQYIGGGGGTTRYTRVDKLRFYDLDYLRSIINNSDRIYISSGGMRDSITIISDRPLANNQIYDICFSYEEQDFEIDTDIPGVELSSFENPDLGYAYYNEKGKPVIHLYENTSGEMTEVHFYLRAGGFNLDYFNIDQLGVPFKHSSEEHMSALRDFCNSTNYKNWGKHTNWFSDDPLWEWGRYNSEQGAMYGNINFPSGHPYNKGGAEEYKFLIDDHVVYLNFDGAQYTGIHGTLPPSFEIFMDDALTIDLGCCALYGEIPYNIRYNPNWQKFGWNCIAQNVWYGGGFDLKDSNLQMKDEEVMFADGTKSTAYEELAKHKLTLISVGGPSEAMCNLCLAYANKGFQYIYAAQDWSEGTQAEAQKAAYLYKNVPNVSVYYRSWANGNLGRGLSQMGSTFLLDSEGYVVDYAPKDWSIGEDFYINRLSKHLLDILGEPEDHEPYVPNENQYYTSTDYSHDGEVMTLQQATVGRGIDLVFMGDQYVDTLLVEGGKYEEDMRSAMEYFFQIEPYKTLRDRFNVYVVKAVSPNGNDGPVHKFNKQSYIVFEYARKVPNVDIDNVAITVIHNAPNLFFVSGETGMWESGASIAWIEQGGPSSIICHETGGHGLAKLLDEYVYNGYENNHTQEGANDSFREWIKTAYHDIGWGMNISATDDPDEVPWNHFLKDNRYEDEIGIFKGAWYWPEELWRPSENSVMKESDYLWFNAPSREAIYKRVMELSEGEYWTYDYETFVAFDAQIREKRQHAGAKVHREQEIEKRRIELRPPTIYKGSWRDARKFQKTDSVFEQDVNGNNKIQMAPKTSNEEVSIDAKPYVMYKGKRIAAEEFYQGDTGQDTQLKVTKGQVPLTHSDAMKKKQEGVF